MRIFVCGTGVECGAPYPAGWSPALRACARGQGAAEALVAVGIRNARIPATSFDTEGLLALPELHDVAGRRVLVLRGQGGRELLGDTLARRGAQVDYVSCYRRAAPQAGAQELVAALRERRAQALTLTSAEGIDNLLAAVGGGRPGPLARHPSLLPHPRLAGHPPGPGP